MVVVVVVAASLRRRFIYRISLPLIGCSSANQFRAKIDWTLGVLAAQSILTHLFYYARGKNRLAAVSFNRPSLVTRTANRC